MDAREDYLYWDEAFMLIASVMAERSKDPNTQVGACLVKDNYILSTGYNGAPIGYNDDLFPWNNDPNNPVNKYKRVCHAESNAIDNFKGNKRELENSTLYCTLFPCPECAKRIVQNGIKKIIYREDKYHDSNDNAVSREILDTCGVEYKQLGEEFRKDYNISLKPRILVKKK